MSTISDNIVRLRQYLSKAAFASNGDRAAAMECAEAIGDACSAQRDWFAGQALVGCVQHSGTWPLSDREIAESCYRMADAMLEAREDRK